MSWLKALLPKALEPLAVRVWIACRPLWRVVFRGRARYCPVCESWTRGFLPHGPLARRLDDARCPVCRSVNRHRLAWIYLGRRTPLLDGSPKRLLHVAPEMSMMAAFRRSRGIDYLSIDLHGPHAMAKMDLMALDAPGDSFDAIYCSHVLEHVADDRKAMREMFRVLRPGGLALIMVPLSDQPTFEDPSITDPAERERVYWQSDHVRLYGMDIRERLAEAGFEVRVTYGRDIADAQQCRVMGLLPQEAMFDARKPLRASSTSSNNAAY
jgi:SAM-dependent methyltransferase